jgi:hypothetical protein
VTEGTGHIIDPDGDARRAMQEAVLAHGPEALSDATIMEDLCRTQLTALPGECILVVSAARANVPALLRDKIPELGTYGAIQSVATTLAGAHDLDNAASLWVVREFARALGMIAPGGTQSIPRMVPGGAGGEATGGPAPTATAGAAGAGVASGAGAAVGSGSGTGVPGGPGMAGGPEFAAGMAAGAGAPPGMAGGTGAPPGMAGAGAPPPTRGSSGSKVINRNTVGIAAAIALVAGYLGVAAAAHLSPFPAKTVATTSSQPPSTGPSTNTSPAGSPSPDASPDPSPTSDYDVLLSKIPTAVQGHGRCPNAGTQYGAIAVAECSRLTGLGAGTIFYYQFSSPAKLASGLSSFLRGVHFHKQRECTTGSDFTDFLTECQSDFNNKTPFMTGSIAEYTSTSNDPIIVTTDRQKNVMAVMVGTNAGDLLSYWKQLNWIVE